MVNIDFIKSEIKLKDKHSVIKVLLKLKLIEKGIKLTDNAVGIFSLIAEKSSRRDIVEAALEKKYAKSNQSGENFISDLIEMKLVEKITSGEVRINPEYLQPVSADLIALDLKIHNLATN